MCFHPVARFLKLVRFDLVLMVVKIVSFFAIIKIA